MIAKSEKDFYKDVQVKMFGEPNQAIWIDNSSGYTCEISRSKTILCYRGYVHIPPKHPFYEMDLRDINKITNRIDVHGGLTFSGLDDISNKYVFGFDCAHSCDFWPIDINVGRWDGVVYRDFEFVKSETEKLASQLKSIQSQWYIYKPLIYFQTLVKKLTSNA